MQARGLQCIKLRQVVIAITLTPVRHKRRMQFLTSAPKFEKWAYHDTPWSGLSEPLIWQSRWFRRDIYAMPNQGLTVSVLCPEGRVAFKWGHVSMWGRTGSSIDPITQRNSHTEF